MVSVIAIHQILQDRATLKNADCASICEGVGQGWDAAVRVNIEKPWLLWRLRSAILSLSKVEVAQDIGLL